ncbi:MAG: heme-binding protein [Alphaproteobacteria bacterium]|nr:heme-binding protein [Alphaproteobacteria bacterium]
MTNHLSILRRARPIFAALGLAALAAPAFAEGPLTVKDMSLSLANGVAMGAIEQCRKDGFQVSATVVNRSGQVMAVLRDDMAGPHTLDSSRRKAYSAASFKTTTAILGDRVSAAPTAPGSVKDITDIVVLAGGVPISAGGAIIGAIGVGGAPTGTADEVCAKAGIAKFAEALK